MHDITPRSPRFAFNYQLDTNTIPELLSLKSKTYSTPKAKMCNAHEIIHTCGHSTVSADEKCKADHVGGPCELTLHTHYASNKCWSCALEERWKEEKREERRQIEERESEEALEWAMKHCH